jgi:hypothetical protein
LGIDNNVALFSSFGMIVLAGTSLVVDVHVVRILAGLAGLIALDSLPLVEVLPRAVGDDGAGAMLSATTFFAWTDLAGMVAEMAVLSRVLLATNVSFLALASTDTFFALDVLAWVGANAVDPAVGTGTLALTVIVFSSNGIVETVMMPFDSGGLATESTFFATGVFVLFAAEVVDVDVDDILVSALVFCACNVVARIAGNISTFKLTSLTLCSWTVMIATEALGALDVAALEFEASFSMCC